MGTVERFEVVEEAEPAKPAQDHSAATAVLLLSLKALSQRALVALSNLFCLLSVGSVFWLFMSIPAPNPNQLVELAMYGVFVLAANWITRRK